MKSAIKFCSQYGFSISFSRVFIRNTKSSLLVLSGLEKEESKREPIVLKFFASPMDFGYPKTSFVISCSSGTKSAMSLRFSYATAYLLSSIHSLIHLTIGSLKSPFVS